MVRISVIIPTYNRAGLIGEAIESVLAQTYANVELIVVDDGSTDETRAVVARYGGRARYLHQANAGASAARNRGLAAARGEYISFLDSDDRMLPHNVAALAQVLDARPEAGVAYGWYYWVDQAGQPLPVLANHLTGEAVCAADTPWPGGDMAPYGMLVEGQALAALVLEDSMMMGSTLIRRACLEAVGGMDVTLAYHEHWDMYLRLALAGHEYGNCRRPVVLLRRHAQNQSSHLDEMLASRLQVLTRVFADPRAAQISATVQARAFYRCHIELATAFYYQHRFDRAAECVQHALAYQPLEKGDQRLLAYAVAGGVATSDADDPAALALRLMTAWPAAPELAEVRRQVMAKARTELAFRQYHAGEYGRAWRTALGVVARYPSQVRNRGLARVGVESLLGPRVFRWLRGQKAPTS